MPLDRAGSASFNENVAGFVQYSPHGSHRPCQNTDESVNAPVDEVVTLPDFQCHAPVSSQISMAAPEK